MKKTILLVEDEPGLADSLATEFQFEDYEVIKAADGLQAVTLFHENQNEINLIILDWMLPKLDGLGVLRRIRRQSLTVPVIMLTARDYVGDKVAGLQGGADDYVTKPFDIEELLARMQVALRHQENHVDDSQYYRLADLNLDVKTKQVSRHEQNIQLTQREFQLLLELFKHSGETCTREELLNAVWGIDFEGQPNIVDVYVRYLRNKIDCNPHEIKLIQTVRGVGYALATNYS
ncbi:DNA-binding response regulator [Lactobacillus sp. CBA3605]|uniref:response regulator transcription factor n=1 Tax=Lactobacillus sp. CBA3605 TaxID=2099788 RepID=UPI000CFD2B71|nr:response regulator transcription factor [Lactobacillus sp. CBA3605]AVK61534.1 DNA-binding response regulator [Lactobacillus sp. CBA3605]